MSGDWFGKKGRERSSEAGNKKGDTIGSLIKRGEGETSAESYSMLGNQAKIEATRKGSSLESRTIRKERESFHEKTNPSTEEERDNTS